MTPYTLALELTILLAFWLCLAVWQRDRSTPGRTTFVALTASGILWCLGELLYQRGLFSELTADRIRYAGVLALPAFWAGLAAHATRLELARRVPWFPLVLLLPMAVPYALLFNGSWSGIFMRTIPDAVDEYGPLWWVTVGYSYALMLAGCALFIVEALRWSRPGRWPRRVLVGVAPLVPMAGNASYIAGGMADPNDPTPVLFGVALLALQGALFRGDLLQALPISQHDLIEQLPLGVILTDCGGVVFDLNPAAERQLGMPEAQAMGRNLDAVLAEAHREVRAEVSPIFSNEREAGQLVLIHRPGKPED